MTFNNVIERQFSAYAKLDIILPLQYDVGVQFQQRDMRDLV